MSRSQLVRAKDMQAAIEVVVNANEASYRPVDRLRHLVKGVCELIDARMGSACQLQAFPDARPMKLVRYIEGGHWTESDRRILAEYFARDDHEEDLVAGAIANMHREQRGVHGPAALRRQDLIDDTAWYRSDHVNDFRRASDIDACIYSGIVGRESGQVLGMTFHRPWGAKKFSERERTLVALIQEGAAAMFLAAAAPTQVHSRLTPALESVMRGLVQGLSEKEIAGRLKISIPATHARVKRLYTQLGVHSRGELVRAAMHRGDR